MQARRILLFFGIVLLLTAAATSVVPVPEQESGGSGDEPTTEAGDESPEFRRDPNDVVELSFEVGGKPRTVDIQTGQRVIVTVEARDPGEVELEGLGRIQNVGPSAPAVFDLFTDRGGLFDVVYTPVEGGERTVASVSVGPAVRRTDDPGADHGDGSRSREPGASGS